MEEITEEIIAKVKIDFDYPLNTQVVVRKVVRNENGDLVGIFGLGKDGQWLEKLEGCPYPDECYLPTAIYDNSGEIDPTSLPTTLMGLPIVEVDPPIVLGSFNDYKYGY